MIKKALEYIADLRSQADTVQVVNIAGKTYATASLQRYDDKIDRAEPLTTYTLTSVIDYIKACSSEFKRHMILHVLNPRRVRLISFLDCNRRREVLLDAVATVSDFPFDKWLNQEEFMINVQANFIDDSSSGGISDLDAVKKMAGNAEKKSSTQFSDDGISQVAVITAGAGVKAEALVPNPVYLRPYRTFHEVEQPMSPFIFRISDDEKPRFMLAEADGCCWQNEAISNVKSYLNTMIQALPNDIRDWLTVIG